MPPEFLEIKPREDATAQGPPPSRPRPQRPRIALLIGGVVLLTAFVLVGLLALREEHPTPPQPVTSADAAALARISPPALSHSQLTVSELSAHDSQLNNLVAQALQISNTLAVQGTATVNGALTAGSLAGQGQGVTGVDAALLGGEPSSYFSTLSHTADQAATNLTAQAALLAAPNVFTAANTFVTGLTVDGSASVAALKLTSPLTVSSGGTGLTSVSADGILYGQGGPSFAVATPAAPGLCLVSGSSDLSWGSCVSGNVNVSSLDGLTGALSIADSVTGGGTISLDNAMADGATKGIAAFNSTNFMDNGSGVINTVQDIATTSSPTFASVTTNAVTPNAALTVGDRGQPFTLQGSGSSVITASTGGDTTTLAFTGTPTASQTYTLDSSAPAGTYAICTTAGNCGDGGSVSGTTDRLAKFTSPSTVGDSSIADTGSSVTVTPGTDTATTFQIQNAEGSGFFTASSADESITTDNVNVGAAGAVGASGRLFSDGFESGDFSLWSYGSNQTGSSTIAVDSKHVHSGKYAAEVDMTGSGFANAVTAIQSNTNVDARAWVYLASHGSTWINLFTVADANDDNEADVFIDTSGHVDVWDGALDTEFDSTTTLPTGSWHELELDSTIDPVNGSYTLYFDNQPILSMTGIDTGSNPLSYFLIGDGTPGRVADYYIDDVSVDTVRPGESANLNVNDSLHVSGTSSFDNTLHVQTLNPNSSAVIGYAGGSGSVGVYGESDSSSGIGVYGYSTSGFGVQGISDGNDAGYFYSDGGLGLYAQSSNSYSGYFQSANDSNSAATLVSQQYGSGTADLIQAQDSTGDIVFNVAPNGNTGIGVENPDSSTVALNVNGAVQQTGFDTPDAAGTYDGDWTELAECDIDVEYQSCDSVINMIGDDDGDPNQNHQATISAKVYQQNPMGQAPIVLLQMNGVAEYLNPSDFEMVTTENDASATVVKLYFQNDEGWGNYYYTPQSDVGDDGWTWTPESAYVVSLPSGTETGATYGDTYANTLTVQPSSSAADTVNVTDESGNSVFDVDTNDDGVTLNGGAGLAVDGLEMPATPTLSSSGTGGSLTAGTYEYLLAAQDQDGNDTAAVWANPGSVTTTGSASVNTLTWTAVPYAASYDVFRSADGGTTWWVENVPADTTSMTDDGSTYSWGSEGYPNTDDSYAGGLSIQQGSNIYLDGGDGAYDELIHSDPSNNALSIYNGNSNGAIELQGDSLIFQDTTGWANDFSINDSGQTVFQNRVDSTSAFQVMDSGGGTVLGVDTQDDQVLVGDNAVNVAGETLTIQTSTDAYGFLQTDGTVSVGSYVTSGYGGQGQLGTYSDNSLGLFADNGGAAETINTDGSASFTPYSDSADSFDVQDAGGNSVLGVDTDDDSVNTDNLNVGSPANQSGPSRLFTDGFESGNFSLWDYGANDQGTSTATVQTATVHSGKFAAEIKDTGTGYATIGTTNFNNATSLDIRAYVNIASQGANDLNLFGADDGPDDTEMDLYRDASGDLEVWDGTTSTNYDSGVQLPTGSWHEVELDGTMDPAIGSYTVYLDNTQILTITGVDTGMNPLDQFYIGDDTAGRVGTWYIDDISLDTVRPGDSANLNVGDSLHVSGTSSFGNSIAIASPANTWGITDTDGNIAVGTYLNEYLGSADIGTGSNNGLGFFTGDNSNNAELLGTDGSATFKPYVDSSTAFQVENSSGNPIFDVNTANSEANVNGSLVLQGSSSQTANLITNEDASGDTLSDFDADGNYDGEGTNTLLGALQTPWNLNLTLVSGGTLTLGQTYYYAVSATNGDGETVIQDTPPSVTPTVSGTQAVDISWSQVPGATGYNIYRNTSGDWTTGSQLLAAVTGAATTSYTDNGAATTAGLPTNYPGSIPLDVTAMSGGTALVVNAWGNTSAEAGLDVEGNCGCDSGVSTTLDVEQQPGSVGEVINANGPDDALDLQDTYGSTEASYSSAGNFTSNGTNNSDLNLSVPTLNAPSLAAGGSLTPATTYYYELTAVNAQGETTGSSPVSATPTSGNQTVDLSWSYIPGATGYNLYRNTTGDFTSGSQLLASIPDGLATGYADTGSATTAGLPPLSTPGTQLTLQAWNNQTDNLLNLEDDYGNTLAGVNAYGSGFFGANSIIGNSRLSVGTDEPDVIGQTIQAAGGQTANLQQFEGPNGEVLSQVDGGGNASSFGTNTELFNLATPTLTSVSTGTSFYYCVTAVNAQGETACSTGLGMAVNTATITWNQVPGATGYNIYRNTLNSFSSGALLAYNIPDGTVTSFTDTGATTTAGLPPTSVSGTGLTLQGWQSQSGNVLSVQNAAETDELSVDTSGDLSMLGTDYINTDSTAALNVEEAGVNNNVLTVDTTDGNVSVDTTATVGDALDVGGDAEVFGDFQSPNMILSSSNTANNLAKNYTVGTGGVSAGDVVVLANEAGNSAVVDTTTGEDPRVMGVAAYSQSAGNIVGVAISGNTQVMADSGAVNIGDTLVTSSTSGEVTVDNNATSGILGYATTAKASGASGLVGVYVEVTAGTATPDFSSNSAAGFEIQQTGGSALLTADTASMTVTVTALVVSANLTVDGHFITGGSNPGIVAGPAACTSPPTVNITGNDTAGTITIETGTGCSAGGKLATITFASAFGTNPHVNLTPAGLSAVAVGAYVNNSTLTTTTFDLDIAGAPTNATTYTWNYLVVQ